ncbi:unnamed protein product [Rhizopus stolonifer]
MSNSLLNPLIAKACIGSAIILGTWFTIWKSKNLARTEKEIAYVFTLLTSFVTSLCSLPLVYTLFTTDLAQVVIYRAWTVQVTVFFMTFLFLDLAIGVLFYSKKVDILTGWLHHTVYLGILTWTIKNQYCSVFVMMCLLEIPTFFLSLGSVRSRFRNDYLFAWTFLCTRILFHAYTIYCAWRLEPMGSIMTALSAFLPLHCHWFYGFIKQQIRLSKPDQETIKVLTPKIIEQPIQQHKTRQYKERKVLFSTSFHTAPISVH